MKGRFFGFFGKKIAIFWIVLLSFLFVGVSFSYASENPSFPSCSNPSGSVIASYTDGTHGIPGDTNTYTGADTVYSLNSNQALQCFCGSGQGIQTNWWKVGNLSQNDISYWQSQGWTYIPDGSAWGLDATGYLAINGSFSCTNNNPNSGGNSGGGNGGGGNPSAPVCSDIAPSSAPYITSIVSGTNSVTLTWTPAGNPVTYYLIAYGTQPGVYTFGNPNVGNVTTYTINGLSGGQTYYFAVKGVNNCMPGPFSNEVSNNVSGGSIQGPATGFNVLGATTSAFVDPSSIVKTICAQCFWWQVLLGEIIALVILFLVIKRKSLPVNKYLLGSALGLAAYLAFLILNKGHVCPDAGINFWTWSIPCRYFWVLDAIMVLAFSFIIRRVDSPKPKSSKTK